MNTDYHQTSELGLNRCFFSFETRHAGNGTVSWSQAVMKDAELGFIGQAV